MSLALRIESGRLANTLLPIQPGGTLRIGRTEQADCAFPEDNFLSRVHFEVQYDGCSCKLRDLKSSNGTRLNGIPISESELKIGDEITAGQTRFSIRVHHDQPKPDAPSALTDPAVIHERLLTIMRSDLQPLYAVLDTAHEPSVFKLLLESKTEYAWLFEGEAACQLAHFAPYLVPLRPESPLLPVLVKNGWGKNWGIYLTSAAAPWELLAFLRRLLVTQQPDGTPALLRFYDPRVLRTLLPCSTPLQRPHLFGPVQFYMMEAEEPDMALGLHMSARGLEKTEMPLSGSQAMKTTLIENKTEGSLIPGRAMDEGATTMFVLRKEQMEPLSEVQRDSFKEAMLKELRAEFPIECAVAGEVRMEALVQYGCTRPQRYGIRDTAEIRRYIKLMVKLGRDFDVEPQTAWASQVLGRRLAPAEKLDMLEAAAKHYLHSSAR
jgi:hypothetical protein